MRRETGVNAVRRRGKQILRKAETGLARPGSHRRNVAKVGVAVLML
ncbi:MAG: hypothetical protein ACE5JQ_02720 [Candidatus Methylomirabilales bacterium]